MSIILLSCIVFFCLGSEARNTEPVEEAPATNAEARRAVVCEDDYETCGQYEEYCETNYYVKNHCLKTCGTCNVESTESTQNLKQEFKEALMEFEENVENLVEELVEKFD